MNNFKKKSQRKGEENISMTNKESSTNSKENSCQTSVSTLSSIKAPYLQIEYATFTPSFCQCNIGELIRQPEGVDRNEWIANNMVSFCNQIFGLYGVLSEFCTPTTCPSMAGAQNSVYLWFDERGKRVKCSAPQYIELSTMFIQETLSNETIFPRRADKKFPATFDSPIRKMTRFLFHCLSHIYAAHFCKLIEFELHLHLNSLFLHFMLFLIKFDIIPTDSTNPLILSSQIEVRDFRLELESLSFLYQLLSKQWQHMYDQTLSRTRKLPNNQ